VPLRLTIVACVTFVAGCAALTSVPSLPERSSIVRDQLDIRSDFVLPQKHRLVEELVALRSDMGLKLDLPTSDEPIRVYLFDNAHAYTAFMGKNHPTFPDRRAFFVESDTQLVVYAYWGDRVAEDLRHEMAHGYLHSVTPNVPLWMDEGIAEFYELPRGQRGRSAAHIALLWKRYQERHWSPNLRRLESLNDVARMEQTDYAEAWLWMHFLLETSRDRTAIVQSYLAELRRTGTAAPMSHVLSGVETVPEESLAEHLAWLATH
jgi:hypothetical protein